MVKKTILYTLGFLVVYELLIRQAGGWWSTGQNGIQHSIIAASDFLYTTKRYQTVMIGSSMSEVLSTKASADSLLPGFYNLSFAGKSVYDGLRLLKESRQVPKMLLIESNLFFLHEDESFPDLIYNGLGHQIRRRLYCFRERFQPVGMAVRLPLVFKKKVIEAPKPDHAVVDSAVYLKLVEKAVETRARIVDESTLEARLQAMTDYVSYFQKQGTQVVFFEMPNACAVFNLPQVVQQRKKFRAHFEQRGNCYFVTTPPCQRYFCYDGIHLYQPDAETYLTTLKADLAAKHLLSSNL
jgi:hypothetical protein